VKTLIEMGAVVDLNKGELVKEEDQNAEEEEYDSI